MEQWVRAQNERDRQVLAWLRAQVDDAVIIAAARRCASRASSHICPWCAARLGWRRRDMLLPGMPLRKLASDISLAFTKFCNARTHPFATLSSSSLHKRGP